MASSSSDTTRFCSRYPEDQRQGVNGDIALAAQNEVHSAAFGGGSDSHCFQARSRSRQNRLLVSSYPSVRPFVCLFAWISPAPTGRIFVKFDIRDWYEKSIEKIYVWLKLGILRQDLSCFIVGSDINSFLSRQTVIGCFAYRKDVTTASTKWSYCCVSIITMVTGTRHFITLCVHCPSFLSSTVSHTARLWRVEHNSKQCLSFGDIVWTAEACSATLTPRTTDVERCFIVAWLCPSAQCRVNCSNFPAAAVWGVCAPSLHRSVTSLI